ncbi:unnamed protein product [Rotaria sp. Silwood2]|nr:unnamed protein product [Rotaria sp. Silwood2]CAF2991008.1 unnamed protein product [Rotaria sp. Silwood2]CAF4047586.1 unnamed protein product [Rotaria sp. Silwood2]CAF4522930.1 unnamed protein product [Rotaria sp. Silwood2]
MSSIQSSDTTQTESVYNPERNEELGGDDMVHPPFAIPPAGRGVAIRSVYQRWAHGVVPYEFASNITVNDSIFIVKMMRAMENLTQVNNTQCISFRPRDTSDLYYITIFNGSGCYAPVGSWGNYIGNRPVSFMHGRYSTCMVSGIIQHELTHVLGFYHEQSRPDRDSYVSIQWSNIQPANVFNFDKYNYSQVDTLMTSYDYGSVMHYERNAFAINDSGVTIIPTQNASAFIGQRVQLSPIDILEIQRYYGCVSTPADVSITTVTSTTTSTKSTTTTAMTTASVTTTKETTTNETTNETTTNKITTNEATTNTSIRNAFRSYFEIYVICFTSIIYFSN